MNINSVGSSSYINQIQNLDSKQLEEKMEEINSKGGFDRADFSDPSKMMNFMSNLDANGKQEMKDFRTKVMKSLKSGKADFSTLASEAPESLQ